MTCPECHGDGEVEVERTVGGVNANGPWQSYVSRMVECERCFGSGEVDED